MARFCACVGRDGAAPNAAPAAGAAFPLCPLSRGGAEARAGPVLAKRPLRPPRTHPRPNAALRAAAAADPSLQEELAPPIAPVTISFQDLRYFVPHPKKRGAELELLKGITGSFLPGKLVALVGPWQRIP